MSKIPIRKHNPAWVVLSVTPHDDYTLDLIFNDGSRRIFDAKNFVTEPYCLALKNKDLFMMAHVEGPSVGWTDEIDIAPEYLYENSRVIN